MVANIILYNLNSIFLLTANYIAVFFIKERWLKTAVHLHWMISGWKNIVSDLATVYAACSMKVYVDCIYVRSYQNLILINVTASEKY